MTFPGLKFPEADLSDYYALLETLPVAVLGLSSFLNVWIKIVPGINTICQKISY